MASGFLEQLFGLNGQTAVVIGGTGVLGGALAEGLAQAGANVIVAGRSHERGAERVAAIEQAGGRGLYLEVNAEQRESVQQLLRSTLARFGKVDMLVNCAGTNSAVPYAEITDEQWNSVVTSQLFTTHLGCQIFAPQMAQQADGGSILNIGSVTSHLPLSRVFAYSAAKAAVINLTKNVAREYATQKVRVNAICPGFFPAEQNRKILDAQRVENIMRQTPMARFGEPKELVAAAILLLSRAGGSFITGEDLYVDGGFTSMRF
ncbi:putative oxidoreductase UxuB [Anatilimnocola aggregata]|uniref:Putative oxidoreductase UxuB n=1 Tax=Anatilimnocola aggregata TaxID=2528021 RepID=A0A517YJW2_9BACT|nr:SDR family oxidoreductase [Anatilimnocola aggregata]QDU30510.1 putative oxidoreductase UxuB [Anatilimnocola aggregata]